MPWPFAVRPPWEIAAVVAGYPHHVVQRGVRSLDIFTGDADRETYLRFMRQECARHGCSALAWCLMTNHVHLMLVPERTESLALAVGRAHRSYTRERNFREGVRGRLFQGRFFSYLLDEKHLMAAARYVELNPVSARIVKQPQEYEWSSARFHLGKRKTDPLVEDRSLCGTLARERVAAVPLRRRRGDRGEADRGEDVERTAPRHG